MAAPVEAAGLDRLRALLAADPANVRLWQRCVDAAFEARDYDALLALAGERLAVGSDDPSGLFYEASALIGLGRYEDALASLERLPEPTEPAVLFNIGLCLYALGRFADARDPLERCYAAGERGPDLLRLLISTSHHTGDLDRAIEIAAAHLEVVKENAALAGVCALAFLDADDAVRAARCADAALTRNPDSIDGLIVRGTLRLAQLRTDEASADLSRVVERAPDNGRAWIGLGTAALLNRDLPAAKTALRRGVERMPDHVGSWQVLAWTELVTGDLPEAERLFQRSLELDRNFSESHGGLASVAALRGDLETARREIEIANRLDAECVSAKFAESVLLGAAGNPDRARALVQSTIAALAQRADNPLAALLAGLARP